MMGQLSKIHRHHVRYKSPEILIHIPAWFHWTIHCPAALLFWGVTQQEWDADEGHAIREQNKAAKIMLSRFGITKRKKHEPIALKHVVYWLGRMLIGYPNPLQRSLNIAGLIVWGQGWKICAPIFVFWLATSH